ncbi:hypothetical protein ACP4OV_008203 [Aristida adscensionis]
MSWGRFHPGPFRSEWRPMGRCSTAASSAQKPAPCTVVVIDDDDDGDSASDSEVFIVDRSAAGEAAAAPAAGRQSKKGSSASGNVIDLDDDDGDGIEEDVGGDKAGPSTARGAGSPEATTPVRGSPRNRYGLDCTSDCFESDDPSEGWASDSSDGGSSDCEILDDASGSARKAWEAASTKKMCHGIHESKYGRSAASTSSTGSEAHPDENTEGFFGKDFHFDESFFGYFNDAFKERVQNSTDGAKDGHGPSTSHNAKECSNGNVSSGKETHCSGNSTLDTDDMACNDKTYHSNNGTVPEKAPEGIKSPRSDGTFAYTFVSANRVFPTSSADWKDGSPPMSISTPEKDNEKIPNGMFPPKDQSPSDDHDAINKDVYSAQGDGSVSCQQTEVPPSTRKCSCSRKLGENCLQVHANSCACAAASIKSTSGNVTSGTCPLPQKDLVDEPEELGQFTVVQDSSNCQDVLIGDREKHKESIEYKRAAEEEWASRQRQLQIQAEEAKKLRKRKKAEAQRLLDMEKRQKQRIQEVRESQRKNEEETRLKEQYRGVVRKELEDTEKRYRDMASILCALGIPVEGGEVKVAYKQALLKFHPDRVSRSDIYQQVKAEETFKFISRLKEKLPRF